MSDIAERLRQSGSRSEIVERLRESGLRSEIELHEDREEAADRIEELEAKLDEAVARTEVAEATIASVSDDALDKAIDASRALIAKMRNRTDDQWRRG